METSDDEVKSQTSSMELQTTCLKNLRTNPIEKVDLHALEKKLSRSFSSHSSSPDSPLDDPFREDDAKHDDDDTTSSSSASSSPKHDSDTNPVFRNYVPQPEQSDPCNVLREATKTSQTCNVGSTSNSITEAPPTQVMEHSKSKYRIPSSVFARNKSTTPMEWSVASNESLFSIQMGNMSFANDPLLWWSDEFGTLGEASTTSDQMFSYSAVNCGSSIAVEKRSRELGLAEATMKEVIRESENHKHGKSISVGRISHQSDGSNASTKSFAFSLLAADKEKGSSLGIASPGKRSQEQLKNSTTPGTVPSASNPEPQNNSSIEPNSPIATGNMAQSKWFLHFPCCSHCL